MMIIGACGICCDVCRLYTSGACTGCAPGDSCSPEKVVRSACPILSCASARGVPFCPHDCPEYPCALFRRGLTQCERAKLVESYAPLGQTFAGWVKLAPQQVGLEPEVQYNGGGPQLYVFCLGTFRVYRQKTIISEAEWGQTKGSTQKVKALFAYLLTQEARGATKDEIVEFLWGDQNLRYKGKSRLYATLYYLRRVLEPDLKPRTDSKYIIHQDGYYKLAPASGYWVDATAFETYYQQALRLEQAGQKDAAAQYWELADGLYQGDYMLSLVPYYTAGYDDCCRWRQYRLKDMYLTVLLQLARYHYEFRNERWSLAYAQKALAEDWCCEEAHRVIMRIKHRAGRRGELIRQYRLCERCLADAEERAPSPETAQLYEQCLQTIGKPNADVEVEDIPLPPRKPVNYPSCG